MKKVQHYINGKFMDSQCGEFFDNFNPALTVAITVNSNTKTLHSKGNQKRNMPLSENQKKEIVAQITMSNTFKNAPTSIGLLQYLYDATAKGTFLKESVIDIEFFGSKENADTNNPKVRVNVYNLRKEE